MKYGKEEVRAFLEEKGIAHRWEEHEAVFTIAQSLALGMEGELEIVKNLFLRDAKGKSHYLLVVRADQKVDLRGFGEQFALGKLSFASESRLMQYLGLTKGAVSPFGILNDEAHAVEVYVDAGCMQMHEIGVHPNDNTASVYLSPEALIALLEEIGAVVHVVELARE